ncbi:MAG: hypothetical protein EA427_03620 [Spirochaetaceae bacterium]|nr:MAG: hypothetical protein EA427_03620 [Spirochaetaceae bacterium]
MYRSSSFIKQCHRLDSPDRALEELFLRHLPRLPRGIGLELYRHATQSDRGTDRDQLHQLLADMVDLLWMEYDDEANPLTREDWEVLRDLIDEHAQELDLNLVQYVMERVVSNRAL